MKKVDIWIFIAFFMFLAIWFIHIPFLISPNVLKVIGKTQSQEAHYLMQRGKLICIFVFCLIVFMGKKYLDSKFQTYRLYRICATFIANIAFMFVWVISFALGPELLCRYWWNSCGMEVVCNFPIELYIGYLLYALPMFFMLCLILYYAFHYKILSKINCIGLTVLLAINLIRILIHFISDGFSCYD